MRLRALALAPLALTAVVLAPLPTAFAQEATPTPDATPRDFSTPSPECPKVYVVNNENPQDPNTPLRISVTANNGTPTRAIDYTLGRVEADKSVTIVRSAPAATSTVEWTVRLPQTTTLTVTGRYTGQGEGECVGGDPEETRTVAVRPLLTIAAKRNAPRDYTFSGRVLPGRGQTVGLFRITPEGRRVFTADGVVGANGLYSINRRFTGSGDFGFEVRVVESSTNLAGASRIRPTVIH